MTLGHVVAFALGCLVTACRYSAVLGRRALAFKWLDDQLAVETDQLHVTRLADDEIRVELFTAVGPPINDTLARDAEGTCLLEAVDILRGAP